MELHQKYSWDRKYELGHEINEDKYIAVKIPPIIPFNVIKRRMSMRAGG